MVTLVRWKNCLKVTLRGQKETSEQRFSSVFRKGKEETETPLDVSNARGWKSTPASKQEGSDADIFRSSAFLAAKPLVVAALATTED